MRKDLLVEEQVYHVFTRSIAEYKIFNNEKEFLRMLNVLRYYQQEKPDIKFSKFAKLKENRDNITDIVFPENVKIVEIIAYCIMPTHIHLILKQLKQNGISIFVKNILNSYSRYFNTKHNRKGPLWEGRFKSVLVETDEYLLHLTRYIHLNPVTAGIIEKPEDWQASSFKEYLSGTDTNKICEFKEILYIKPEIYKEFVEDRISYQRELARIKSIMID